MGECLYAGAKEVWSTDDSEIFLNSVIRTNSVFDQIIPSLIPGRVNH